MSEASKDPEAPEIENSEEQLYKVLGAAAANGVPRAVIFAGRGPFGGNTFKHRPVANIELPKEENDEDL